MAVILVWRPKVNLLESVLSFPYVGARNQAQVTRLGSQCLSH